MIQIIKELNIEVSKPNVFQAVVAKQYDMNTRFIKATFVDYGDKITIPQSDTLKVVINALRNDGEAKGFDGVINDDGTVTVPLHSWMLELVGTVICDISVIDTEADDNKKLTTTSFTLIVEKAAWGGDGITSDPQYDVLIELLDRCAAAGELAEEALQKSNEANSKYDACVEATRAAETVAQEWQNEVNKTNTRLDELIALRYTNDADAYVFNHDVLDAKVEITTSGAVAYIRFSTSDAVTTFAEAFHMFIPAAFSPFDERVLLEHNFGEGVTVTLTADQTGEGACISVETEAEETVLSGAAWATYPLANLFIPELTDIRNGYDGTNYDVAGGAVRASQKNAADAANLVGLLKEDVDSCKSNIATLQRLITKNSTSITEIEGNIKVLTETTTDDNGKILQMVNGKWVAVDINSSAVKTFVDDYINSALGGEY